MFGITENIEPICKSHAGFGQKWKIPQCLNHLKGNGSLLKC